MGERIAKSEVVKVNRGAVYLVDRLFILAYGSSDGARLEVYAQQMTQIRLLDRSRHVIEPEFPEEIARRRFNLSESRKGAQIGVGEHHKLTFLGKDIEGFEVDIETTRPPLEILTQPAMEEAELRRYLFDIRQGLK